MDTKRKSGNIVFYIILACIIGSVLAQQEFFAPTIHVISQRVNLQTKRVLLREESDFFTTIDVLDVQKEFVRMEGWVCSPEIESLHQEAFVVLRNGHDTVAFSVMRTGRPDVADAFKSEKYFYSGFKLIIPTCRIKKGTYQVGFLVEATGIRKVKFTDRVVEIPDLSSIDCEQLSQNIPVDNVSLQDFYYREVRAAIANTKVVGYVGDPLPSPFYEIKSGEAQYCVAPVLVVVMRGEPVYDTLIGYFPSSRSILNPQNPLYGKREQWNVMKDFENGILLLTRKR